MTWLGLRERKDGPWREHVGEGDRAVHCVVCGCHDEQHLQQEVRFSTKRSPISEPVLLDLLSKQVSWLINQCGSLLRAHSFALLLVVLGSAVHSAMGVFPRPITVTLSQLLLVNICLPFFMPGKVSTVFHASDHKRLDRLLPPPTSNLSPFKMSHILSFSTSLSQPLSTSQPIS